MNPLLLIASAAAALSLSPSAAWSDPLKFEAEATQFAEWTVEVSSRLSPQGGNTYGPENLLDGPETAWVEGAAGEGVGEWVKITNAGGREAMKFQAVMLWNGYQKSQKSFRENGRVREIAVTWEGGAERIEAADRSGMQTVRLSHRVSSPWVKFEILTVYSGSQLSDTALSGLSLDLEEFNYEPSPKPASAAPEEGSAFTKQVAGRWDAGRHTVEYRLDGTFMLDPEPGEWVPLGTWRIDGGELVERWKDEGQTNRKAIVSIDSKKMVIRVGSGKVYELRRLGD